MAPSARGRPSARLAAGEAPGAVACAAHREVEDVEVASEAASTRTPSPQSLAHTGRRVRWADLASDSESERAAPAAPKAPGPPQPRWADLASEEEGEEEEEASASEAAAGEEEEEEAEELAVRRSPGGPRRCAAAPASRPQFAKVGRAQRVQQVEKAVAEFCSLDFDAVGAEEQSGVALRMLATLKSLASADTFWDEGGQKREEARYELLGFGEEDMYALGSLIRRAAKHVERRSWRKAYEVLSGARPWLLGQGLEELRAQWAVEKEAKAKRAARREERGREREQEAAEGWTLVEERSAARRGKATRLEVPAATGRAQGRGGDSVASVSRPAGGARAPLGVPGGRPSGERPQCQFLIGIEEEPAFRVVRRLLGRGGEHVKFIAAETGAKLRLRGRGSGFAEGPEQLESEDPLMLCVSARDRASYGEAVRLTRELVEGVHAEYRDFCAERGQRAPRLSVQIHEGPREGSRRA